MLVLFIIIQKLSFYKYIFVFFILLLSKISQLIFFQHSLSHLIFFKFYYFCWTINLIVIFFTQMFEMELKNSKENSLANERLDMLKKVFESISDIVDQVEINASNKGLSIQVMDSMHVSFADIFFSCDAFSSYRCDRDVQIALHLKNLLNILKVLTLSETSVLTFSCEDNPTIFKILHVDDESRSEYDITLFQMDSKNFGSPEFAYDCIVRMPSSQFRNVTKSIGLFGDYIKFICEKDFVSFGQVGDLVSGNIKLYPNETLFLDCTTPVDLEIAKKYVLLISKISTMGDEISLNMGNECPIYFEINMKDLGYYKFYVALKVANN